MSAAIDEVPSPADGESTVRRRIRPGVCAAALVLAAVVVAAIRPALLAGGDPNAVNVLATLRPPSGAHWFGTDQLGRDEYTRVVYGARLSLLIGTGATGLATLAATALGLAAALGGRIAGAVITRLFDVLLAFPGLLLALLIIAVVGEGTLDETLAIALAITPGLARVVRARTLEVRSAEYVDAAVILGLRRGVILWRHVLPNALQPLLVLATVGIGESILAGAALSFLGLGPKPPSAEWGSMISDGRDFLQLAWWTGVMPGVFVAATVVCATILGRYAQESTRRRAA